VPLTTLEQLVQAETVVAAIRRKYMVYDSARKSFEYIRDNLVV